MTATVQQELTDGHRAALAVCSRIDDGLTLPGLVDRGRWRTLLAEVMALEAHT